MLSYLNMKSSELNKEQLELIKCLIEQNWLQARHVEDERLWFTNIYFIVVSGILSYLGSSKTSLIDPVFRCLLLFFLLFAFLGLIVTLKLSAELGNHINKIEKILNEKAIDLKDYMGLPINVGLWKYFKVRHAFLLFYIFTIVLWCILLALSLYN